MKSSSNNGNQRPDKSKRTFVSDEVEKYLEIQSAKIKNEDIARIFVNCYPNTLDTTVEFDKASKDTFIITGDIKAMWLRDSSFQVYPYLQHCLKDSHLNDMFLGLFNRQIKCILIDPYANAFNKTDKSSPWIDDQTYKLVNGSKVRAMTTKLWERKFELDSLMSLFFIMCKYYEVTKNGSFITDEFYKAIDSTLYVIQQEKRGTDDEDKDKGPEYTFQRSGLEPFDSQHQGRGNPCKTCGLVKCNFRNSDDATTFSYNIPENAMIASTFLSLADMLDKIPGAKEGYAAKIRKLGTEIKDSIYKHGILTDYTTDEQYFAFEVDGFGNSLFMDEPGYPSLISLPFLGFCSASDQIFLNTKKRILSDKNPYYITGKSGSGVASSHSYRKYIWPLFTLMQGITSIDKNEIKQCLDLLVASAKSTGFMHESFHIDEPSRFTRSWFSWANSFFGVFIDTIFDKCPELLIY